MFIQPNHDVLDSSFDKAFRLGDFFEAEPDKALWRQLDDRNRSVDSCDVEATKDLLLPSDTFIDRGITSVRPNSSLPTPQSRGSLKAGTTQPKERSSPNIKSDPFTEAAWQEILEAVSPIYLEKSVKEILEILPERSTHKPRFVPQRHRSFGG